MMKKLSLYKIRDLALKAGRVVYSIQQLANLVSISKNISKVYSSRMVKNKLAVRVLRGKISFTEDESLIATQLIEPSYISLHSALLFHGIIQQVSRNITCVTTRNSITYEKKGIIYHKITPKLFYGYKRHSKEGSYIFVAEPEKALIDGIYLGLFSIKDFKEYSNKLNMEKLKDLINRFKGKGSRKLKEMIK